MGPFFLLSFGNRVLFCIAFNFIRCIVPLNKSSLKVSSSLRRIFPLQIRWKRERERPRAFARHLMHCSAHEQWLRFHNWNTEKREKTVAKLSLSSLVHDSFLIQILNDLYLEWIFFWIKHFIFLGGYFSYALLSFG